MPKTEKVKVGDFVEVDYIGSTEDGIIFDTSIGVEADFEGVMDDCRDYKPLKFKVGCHEVLSIIEDALVGMEAGESKTIRVTPDKAYGVHDDKKVKELHLDMLRKGTKKPIVGQQLVLTDNDHKAMPGRVIKIDKERVFIDFNHPLSGKVLIFTLKLLRIINNESKTCDQPVDMTGGEGNYF